jgi:hypothetical protein
MIKWISFGGGVPFSNLLPTQQDATIYDSQKERLIVDFIFNKPVSIISNTDVLQYANKTLRVSIIITTRYIVDCSVSVPREYLCIQ